MREIGVAVQLFSVRDACACDLPGTLGAVAQMGYEGVEFAGHYNRSAMELRRLLADLGLKVAGSHIGWDALAGNELDRTMDFNEELGNVHLICPGLPEERRSSIDAWKETAHLMNAMAEITEKRGMRVGYHNHSVEFQSLEDQIPWDVFLQETTASVVMQLDTGNAMHGGGDVLSILKRYPGRATTIHFKEYSRDHDQALLGEGEVPWQEVFGLCQDRQDTCWYIVEQETYAYPPLKCIELCLKNLKRLLG